MEPSRERRTTTSDNGHSDAGASALLSMQGGTLSINAQGAFFKWLVGVLTAIVVGLAGHAFGYERAIQRVDHAISRVELVEKEIVDLRAAQRQLNGEVARDRESTTKQLDKIDARLDAIYQELRRIR